MSLRSNQPSRPSQLLRLSKRLTQSLSKFLLLPALHAHLALYAPNAHHVLNAQPALHALSARLALIANHALYAIHAQPLSLALSLSLAQFLAHALNLFASNHASSHVILHAI